MKLVILSVLAACLALPSCSSKKSGGGEEAPASTSKPGNSDEGLPGYLIEPILVEVQLGEDNLYTFSSESSNVTGTEEDFVNLIVAIWGVSDEQSDLGSEANVKLLAWGHLETDGSFTISADLSNEDKVFIQISNNEPGIFEILFTDSGVSNTAIYNKTDSAPQYFDGGDYIQIVDEKNIFSLGASFKESGGFVTTDIINTYSGTCAPDVTTLVYKVNANENTTSIDCGDSTWELSITLPRSGSHVLEFAVNYNGVVYSERIDVHLRQFKSAFSLASGSYNVAAGRQVKCPNGTIFRTYSQAGEDLDLDHTSGTLNSPGDANGVVVIAKYSANDEILDFVSFRGGAFNGTDNNMFCNNQNELYVALRLYNSYGTVDLDPGAGTANISTTNTTNFVSYIVKYDNDLNYHMNILFDTTDYSSITGIYHDSNSDSLVVPMTIKSQIELDPLGGPQVVDSIGSNFNFVIARYSMNFVYLNHRMFPHGEASIANGVVFDDDGDMVVVGNFDGNMDFDPGGGGGFNRTAQGGGRDSFLMGLDSSLNTSWIKSYGSTNAGFLRVEPMRVIRQGSTVYLLGRHQASFDANYDSSGDIISHAGSAFQTHVLAFSLADGAYLWSKAFAATDEHYLVSSITFHPSLNRLIYPVSFKGDLTVSGGTLLENGTSLYRTIVTYLSPTDGSLQEYFDWDQGVGFYITGLLGRDDGSISALGANTSTSYDINFESEDQVVSGSSNLHTVHVRFNP